MACSSGNCQSGCNREDRPVDEDRSCNGGGSSCDSTRRGVGFTDTGFCIKCKVNETIAAAHPDVTGKGGDGGRFCLDCFRGNLFGKFRFAVTSNSMISPSDNVLVAFSGGSSSRVALQFVHEMQQKAQKNFEASRDRSLALHVFGVGVAYIDERATYPVASDDFNSAMKELEFIVSSLAPPEKQFFVVPTESIYSPDFPAGKQQLSQLLSVVSDVTGKEDLLDHLRLLSLQKVAIEKGYTKIVLGTCTSRIACHVLEATVKGQGFSLAGDIQYVDARWKIPVLLPLRDCPSEELNMLCTLDRLKTVDAFQQTRSGINGLIASFVKLLQEENPSRESTIVRTAGKLTPFSFNKIPEAGDQNEHLTSKRRQKKYNLKPNEAPPPECYCLVCNSPLQKSTGTSMNGFINGETWREVHAAACSSCQYQILPKDPSSLKNFVSFLPRSITTSAEDSELNKKLREQIQDFLLLDSDDGA